VTRSLRWLHLNSSSCGDLTAADLHGFRDLVGLRDLVIKDAPFLRTLDGIRTDAAIESLEIVGARRLEDIEDVESLYGSLQRVKLQSCRSLTSLAPVAPLRRLRFLEFSDSGNLDTLSPLSDLIDLRELYAWGTTRVIDGDLSPLFGLPLLHDVRMRDRRNYRPPLSTLKESISDSTARSLMLLSDDPRRKPV
jgi:hypothetical protein